MMRLATLFSGIGAPEVAFKAMRIEHEVVLACEIDKDARYTYVSNFPGTAISKDIVDLDGRQYRGMVDLLVGGPPCQDFSTAGLRRGLTGKRGSLLHEFIRLIQEMNPSMFLFENVTGLLIVDENEAWKMLLRKFRNMGYTIYWKVLNTADYGIPQNRLRIYLCGFKTSGGLEPQMTFPPTMPLELKMCDLLEDHVPGRGGNLDGHVSIKYDVPADRMAVVLKKHPGRSNPNIDARIARTMRASQYHRASNAGDANYVSSGRQVVAMGLEVRDGTLVNGIRRLTPRECARLQGFPDSFRIPVSDTLAYIQIGNSISVNVLEAVFGRMLEHHAIRLAAE